MVKFKLFGGFKKKTPVPLSRYVEVARKMMESGKTQAEVASFLKSKGLNYHQIDVVMRHAIKSATLEKETNTNVSETQHSPVPPQPKPSLPSQPVSKAGPSQEPVLPQPLNPNQDLHSAFTPQPSFPSSPPPPPSNESSSMDDDELLMELEEIIDLVLKNKYGDVLAIKKDVEELKKNLKETIESFEKKMNDVKKRLNELENKEQSNYAEINKKIEDLIPRINALESAFKDNIPVMLDELRKIEETLGLRKEENPLKAKDQEAKNEKKVDIDLGDFIEGE